MPDKEYIPRGMQRKMSWGLGFIAWGALAGVLFNSPLIAIVLVAAGAVLVFPAIRSYQKYQPPPVPHSRKRKVFTIVLIQCVILTIALPCFWSIQHPASPIMPIVIISMAVFSGSYIVMSYWFLFKR